MVSYVAQAWAGSRSWAARLDGYNGSAQACTVLGREEKEKRGRKPHVFVASMYVCMYVCMCVCTRICLVHVQYSSICKPYINVSAKTRLI